jgi:fructokinase
MTLQAVVLKEDMSVRIGAIEAGGTKFVCGYGNENGVIEDRVSFPTEQPEETMRNVIAYFQDKQVEAIGIGTFGPIDIDPSSPTYGHVTTTPKPGWSGFDFLGTMKAAFDVPYGWDTDVNAAAFGEAVWGAARGLESCVYYTIGTGVGVGVYTEGKLVHGLLHPEGGHVLTRRHPDDSYEGFCPYHGDCLEGIAAGPAIERRWKVKGSELPLDHPAWEMEAYYIGQAVAATILLLSPKKIILGGGVMHQEQLFPMIRAEVKKNLNGYVAHEAVKTGIDDYIVPPGLGDNAGLCGSLALGLQAARK